ncbi:MAG: Rne/Rng family ribonuclease [Alphaproteobacteria bacterium]|nr:MAG: Rne/Rng family ribonuclease [Alphaproteobacteria bacterium]
MTKRMLIDATHPEETRVVVLSGNRLEEFDHEYQSKKQLKGNIYLAKVTRVEPSLQACFVEYGGNRHGFLAFGEIHPDYYRIPIADREALLAEAAAHRDEESDDGVETLGGDDLEEVRPRRRTHSRNYKIQEVIHRRQIMLVQVVKEERGTKGAALTTFLSLAGRYCVLMPNTPRGGGVSRKITSATDRKRLKSILDELELPDGMAVIVRTAGLDRPKTEIKRDYEYLIRLWSEIRERTLSSVAPALIHEEGNLITRAIRDQYSREIEEVLVDGEEGYKTAKSLMRTIMPSHAKRVQPYKDTAMPMFHRFQVEEQLDAIHSPVVQLRSGGYIVINPTEALVAIDVNSGKSTRERHIEETAYKTNLEAAEEIARQVRLRDLAGLIVVDFIDMEDTRNNHSVEKRLKDAMKSDRARIQIGKISAFGLLELSRQRLRPSVLELTTERCPHCAGTGYVRSTESTALHMLRAIEEEAIRGKAAEFQVTVPTRVALYILNQKRTMLIDLETRYAIRVLLETDDSLIAPDHRIERLRLREPGEAVPVQARSIPIALPDDVDEVDEPVVSEEVAEREAPRDRSAEGRSDARAEEGEDDGNRRKRRRRRRKRRGDGPSDSQGDAQSDGAVGNDEDGGEFDARDDDDRAEGEFGQDEREQDSRDDSEESDAPAEGEEASQTRSAAGDDEGGGRRRRRRGRRGGRNRRQDAGADDAGFEDGGAEAAGTDDARADEPTADPLAEASDNAPVPDALPAPQPEVSEYVPAPEVVASEVVALDAAVAEAPPAKPKRTRRKKAEVEAPAPAPDALVEPNPDPVIEAAAAKPKRPSRRKKATVEAPVVEAVAADAVPEDLPVAAPPEDLAPVVESAPLAEVAPEPPEPPQREAAPPEPVTPVPTDGPAEDAPANDAAPSERYISSAPIQVQSVDDVAPAPERRRGGWWSKRS